MKYQEQLAHKRWKEKRKIILDRDGFRCTLCLNKKFYKDYRVSLVGIGSRNGKLIYILCHTMKSFSIPVRLATNYDITFLNELKSRCSSDQLIALTRGKGKFCKLIATLIIPNKNYLDSIKHLKEISLKDYIVQKTKLQEKYLSSSDFESIKWIDTKGLHIHHNYYQEGKLAWEYPNEALTTLCWQCHEELHENTKVPVLDDHGNNIGEMTPCSKCFGAGLFPEYSHVQDGICFRCEGARFDELIAPTK